MFWSTYFRIDSPVQVHVCLDSMKLYVSESGELIQSYVLVKENPFANVDIEFWLLQMAFTNGDKTNFYQLKIRTIMNGVLLEYATCLMAMTDCPASIHSFIFLFAFPRRCIGNSGCNEGSKQQNVEPQVNIVCIIKPAFDRLCLWAIPWEISLLEIRNFQKSLFVLTNDVCLLNKHFFEILESQNFPIVWSIKWCGKLWGIQQRYFHECQSEVILDMCY